MESTKLEEQNLSSFLEALGLDSVFSEEVYGILLTKGKLAKRELHNILLSKLNNTEQPSRKVAKSLDSQDQVTESDNERANSKVLPTSEHLSTFKCYQFNINNQDESEYISNTSDSTNKKILPLYPRKLGFLEKVESVLRDSPPNSVEHRLFQGACVSRLEIKWRIKSLWGEYDAKLYEPAGLIAVWLENKLAEIENGC